MKSFINAVYIQAYLKDAQNRLSRKRFLTHSTHTVSAVDQQLTESVKAETVF